MNRRARLITSVPYWILVAASAAVGALGLWTVLSRLGTLERGLIEETATNVEVFGGQSWSIVGAVLLGTGILGLFLALALAAATSLVPRDEEASVSEIDDTVGDGFATPTTGLFAGPTITEDPDVEVPSTTPPPAAASHDEPAIDTRTAAVSSDDDRRV